jgi:hypothetical protein
MSDLSKMSVEDLRAEITDDAEWGDCGHLAKVAYELARRLAEAEAIVAKLPKTADGVPITPGMELWGSLGWNNEPAKATLRGTYAEGYSVGTPEWGMNVRPEVECYSTREAAEAAKEAPRD